MSDPVVFDRDTVRRRRDRAADDFPAHDFLLAEACERLADRLLDVKRSFPLALDLGCHEGLLGRTLAGRGGIQTLIQCDLSHKMARRAGRFALSADEEFLPFAPATFDLIISALSLHWVNDIPGALLQIRQALKPDGLFLAAMLGGETLGELRQCFTEAELEEEGGVSPRVSPFVDLRDAAALMQRAGFALPVADIDDVAVTYGDPMALLRDLRGMGETNAAMTRRRNFTRRGTLIRALTMYQEKFAGADGRLPAKFQVIMLTGWNPAPRLMEQ